MTQYTGTEAAAQPAEDERGDFPIMVLYHNQFYSP